MPRWSPKCIHEPSIADKARLTELSQKRDAVTLSPAGLDLNQLHVISRM
jgi:hypothetical protein